MEPIQIQKNDQIYPQVPVFLTKESLRRKTWADLLEINDVITQSGLSDPLTEQISLWSKEFGIALSKTRNVDALLKSYIELMQEMLRDPITLAPLDDQAVLGSDQRTYGFMSLSLYLHSVEETYKSRSPSDPSNPASFTTKPHPVARHLVAWLIKHHAHVLSEELEASYKKMMADLQSHKVVQDKKSDDLDERIQRHRQRKIEREQTKQMLQQPVIEEISQWENSIAQLIQGVASRILEKKENNFQRQMTRLDELEQKKQKELKEYNDSIQPSIEKMEQDIRELEEKIQGLEGGIIKSRRDLDEAKKTDQELQLAIDNTRKAIKKRNKSWINDLKTTVAIIGVCAIATFALQGVLVATSSTAQGALIPTSSGGSLILSF
jgi:hypothetical protein